MKRRKDFLPVVLMTSSIVLLLLLQTLWLVNSYDQARNDLRRQTTDLLRGTILEMRDSLFVKSFKKLSIDSINSINIEKGQGRTMFFADRKSVV